MDADNREGDRPIEIPDDAAVVRQSNWAWLLHAIPWVLFALASLYFDQISLGVFPFLIAALIVVPRYLSHQKTAYILTDDHIVIMRGGIMGARRFDLRISEISRVTANAGSLGSTLGYVGVYLELRDGRVAVFHHIPQSSPLVEHLRTRIDESVHGGDETGV